MPARTAVVLGTLVLFASYLNAQSWTQLSPSGTPPTARGLQGATSVYDATNNRMIVFGGRDGSGNNLNDVWVLTNANGLGGTSQWINLIPNGAAGSPPARSGHSAAYNGSFFNKMIIFGGCGGSCAPVLNDVWVLTNANGLGGTPVWTHLSLEGGPAPRTNSAVAYDPNDEFIIFGGQDGSSNPCSTFSDMWMLTNPTGLNPNPLGWSSPALAGSIPAGQNGAAVAYDDTSGVMTVFGGMGMVSGTCQATNAVSQISNLQPSYGVSQQIIAEDAAGPPPARSFASGAYDPVRGRMLLSGGTDGSGADLNDVWSLSNATGWGSSPVWSVLSPSGGPPTARTGAATIFDSGSERMTVFAGSSGSGVLNDTWVLTPPTVSGLSCTTNAGAPNIVRREGITEQVGDLLLNCTGGTPTPQGQPIPEYTIQLTFNTNVTSRSFPEAANLSEALLTIDEPFPASPSPSPQQGGFGASPGQPLQILCAPLGSTCAETGTGGSPSPYQTQPNVFAGTQISSNALQWIVPIDPPGSSVTRVIRMTNVRANAAELGLSSTFIPTEMSAVVGIQGAPQIPITYPQQVLALANQGAIVSVPSSNASLQCVSHNASLLGFSGVAAFDFSVQAMEGFGYSFKPRNYGAVLATLFGSPNQLVEQNITGFTYRTETSFYSPSLFTPAPTLGLADFGTRIRVLLGPISAGTHLFVPTTITMTGNYGQGGIPGQLQLVPSDETGFSSPGYQPVMATKMVGTTPVAEANYSGSSAYAVYEVVYSDPSVLETVTVPVAVAYSSSNMPATGIMTADLSFVPFSSVATDDPTAPLPRFTNYSTPQTAFGFNSCPATPLTGQILTKSGPQNAQEWLIAVDPGASPAFNAMIDSFTLTQTVGAKCSPVVTSPSSFPEPVQFGLYLPPNSTGTASITIDFTGCGADAGFNVNILLSANEGTSTGSISAVTGYVPGDFAATGHPDLMWQQNSTGQAVVWYLGGAQGNAYQSWAWLNSGGLPGWTLVGAADFNGDGHPDLIWQNRSTRQVAVFYMGGAQGNTYQSWAWLSVGNMTAWTLVSAADLNGDGHPDLIWQNDSTRQVAVFYMGGAQGNTYLSWDWLAGGAMTGWTLMGLADFNGDGHPDVMWQNDGTHQIAVWYMGGSQGNTYQSADWLSAGNMTAWTLVGAADLNADGHPDLIWQNNSSQQVAVWYMGGARGNTYQSSKWVDPVGQKGWKAIARFN